MTRARFSTRLHQRKGAFVIPNPWDAGTARLLAGLGFAALATTSAGLASTLGRRDGAVTRAEALANAGVIVAASDLPVSADLENGYGDAPEAAAETIRAAASVGLVGGSIEDASGDSRRPIYDRAQAVERVAAAVEAARGLGFRFTLTARAEKLPPRAARSRRHDPPPAGIRGGGGRRALCAGAARPCQHPHALRPRSVARSTSSPAARGRASRSPPSPMPACGGSASARPSPAPRSAPFCARRARSRSRASFTFGDDAVPYDEVNRLMAPAAP